MGAYEERKGQKGTPWDVRRREGGGWSKEVHMMRLMWDEYSGRLKMEEGWKEVWRFVRPVEVKKRLGTQFDG